MYPCLCIYELTWLTIYINKLVSIFMTLREYLCEHVCISLGQRTIWDIFLYISACLCVFGCVLQTMTVCIWELVTIFAYCCACMVIFVRACIYQYNYVNTWTYMWVCLSLYNMLIYNPFDSVVSACLSAYIDTIYISSLLV